MSTKKLQKLVVAKDTTCWFPTPDGFEIKLQYIGRKDLAELNNQFTNNTYNAETQRMEQTIDQEGLRNAFVKKALIDWRGMTGKHFLQLNVQVDLTEEEEKEEVEFNDHNRDLITEFSVGFIMMVEEVSTTWIAFANKQREHFAKKQPSSQTNKPMEKVKKTTSSGAKT